MMQEHLSVDSILAHAAQCARAVINGKIHRGILNPGRDCEMIRETSWQVEPVLRVNIIPKVQIYKL